MGRVKTFLVLGGSRGYGLQIVNLLESMHHIVYTVQRTFSPNHMISDPDNKYRRSLDFSDQAEVIPVAQSFKRENVKFDGVVHAVAMREEKEALGITSFDVQEHILVNVTNPVMFIVYMDMLDFLQERAKAVMLLDKNKMADKYLSYAISKRAMIAIAHPILATMTKLDPVFVTCPKIGSGSEDLALKRIANILTGEEEVHRNYADLR